MSDLRAFCLLLGLDTVSNTLQSFVHISNLYLRSCLEKYIKPIVTIITYQRLHIISGAECLLQIHQKEFSRYDLQLTSADEKRNALVANGTSYISSFRDCLKSFAVPRGLKVFKKKQTFGITYKRANEIKLRGRCLPGSPLFSSILTTNCCEAAIIMWHFTIG